MKNKVRLNFGGFYGSQHGELIEDMLDSYVMDNPDDLEKIDLPALRDAYSRLVVDFVNGYFGIESTFEEVLSPRFYNFYTDTISVSMSKKDMQKVIDNAGDLSDAIRRV